MASSELFHMSLARKCQLLFGLAVLLIIAATLFVPGYYMETLVHELNVRRARHLAELARARINPSSPDWRQEQLSLDRWWQEHARPPLKLPQDARPRLIRLPEAGTWISHSSRLELLMRLHRMEGKARPLVKQLMRLAQRSEGWQVAWASWKALPQETRDRLVLHGQTAAERMARALILSGKDYVPPLTEFQALTVEAMQTDPEKNEQMQILHPEDQATTYQFIMAVRSLDASTLRPTLLGIIDVTLPAPQTDQILLWTRVILLLAGVLAGLLAILVFYLIVQKLILAPVRELKVLVEQVAQGDLGARANLTTGDEFEELSDAFNDMLTELDRSRMELETINRSLDTRLGELAETNVALYESNRVKSEFLANVSHELRTPLTSIIGFADLLRDMVLTKGNVDTARFTRYTNNILSSGRSLLEIINDLLDLAKIEAGRVELHRAMFSLRELCEMLVDFVRPLMDKKSQELTVELDEDLPLMNSDQGKIRQIVFNLLSNAIKYTPEGGGIRFVAESLDGGERVRLTVSDTGPGIAREDHDRIFEKFRQLDSSVTREHGGTGLGLAISRELCTMLGGTIRVESDLGEGATFIVELPRDCPETAMRVLPSLT